MGARYEYDETINYIVLAERGIDALYDIICNLQKQVEELEEKNEILKKEVDRLSETY